MSSGRRIVCQRHDSNLLAWDAFIDESVSRPIRIGDDRIGELRFFPPRLPIPVRFRYIVVSRGWVFHMAPLDEAILAGSGIDLAEHGTPSEAPGKTEDFSGRVAIGKYCDAFGLDLQPLEDLHGSSLKPGVAAKNPLEAAIATQGVKAFAQDRFDGHGHNGSAMQVAVKARGETRRHKAQRGKWPHPCIGYQCFKGAMPVKRARDGVVFAGPYLADNPIAGWPFTQT